MIRKVAVGCLIALVAIIAVVLIGGAAVIGALLPSVPTQPSSLETQVATGRPCADPIETQGYKPGPGAFEPNHTGIDFAWQISWMRFAMVFGVMLCFVLYAI